MTHLVTRTDSNHVQVTCSKQTYTIYEAEERSFTMEAHEVTCKRCQLIEAKRLDSIFANARRILAQAQELTT